MAVFISDEKRVEKRAMKFELKRNINIKKKNFQQVGGTSLIPQGVKKYLYE